LSLLAQNARAGGGSYDPRLPHSQSDAIGAMFQADESGHRSNDQSMAGIRNLNSWGRAPATQIAGDIAAERVALATKTP
jgi:hypothetical protein